MNRIPAIVSSAALFFSTALLHAGVPAYTGGARVEGQQYLLAGWNFNLPVDLFLEANHGIGTATTDFEPENIQSFAGSTLNAFADDAPGDSFSGQVGTDLVNNGRHLEFQFSMAEFGDLVLTYATRGTVSGFTTHAWEYSTDGEIFAPHSVIEGRNVTSYSVQSVDFSGVTDLDDTETVFIRILFTGGTGPSGNNRIDNVQFRATALSGTRDGSGTASLVNSTPDSPFNGGTVFDRGQAQDVTLTLEGSFETPLTTVRVEIPADWGGFSPASFNLTGPAFDGASGTVSGNTLTIANANLTTFSSGTVEFTGLETPVEPENFGIFVFEIHTATEGGVLLPIAIQPGGNVVASIGSIRPVNAQGVPLALGRRVVLSGVATVDSFVFSTTRLTVYIQDDTAGVALDHPDISQIWTPVTEGNRYLVIGTVSQFNGLTQISIDGNDGLTDLGPGEMPDPQVFTIAQLLANPEALEGTLVRIRRADLTPESPDWPEAGQFSNQLVSDPSGATFILRINQFTTITFNPQPEFPADIIGIFSQFDNNLPFDSGYQILPRRIEDFLEPSEIEETGFELWLGQFFTPAEIADPEIGGAAADPDGDGLANLLEYAFNGNPTIPSRAIMPVIGQEDGFLTIAFQRVASATDIRYRVLAGGEVDGPLTEIWSSDNHPVSGQGEVVEETVADTVPISGAPRRFLKLLVTLL